MHGTKTTTDRLINREILKLFWRAQFQEKWSFFLTYAGRVPAFIIQNTLVPLFVAYGLEAIIARQFNAVVTDAFIVVSLTILYGALIAIGSWAIAKNGTVSCAYVQRTVFANYLNKDYEFYGNAFYGSLSSQALNLRDQTALYGKLVTLDIPLQFITIFAGLLVIGMKAPLLALVTLICMVFVLSYTVWTSRWRLKYRRRLSEAGSELAGIVGDALSHSTTVKSFAAEEYEK